MNRNCLNVNLLEKVQRHGQTVIARCPACAAAGNDKTGNHLVIFPSGHFACIAFPGKHGRLHRSEIFRLVGLKVEREPITRILWRLKPKHSISQQQPRIQ